MRIRGLCLILLALHCLAPSAQAVVLDQILAVVNGEIIPLSRVESRLFLLQSPTPQRGPYSEEKLQQGLQGMINHKLLLAEAERFGVEDPSREEIQQEVEAFRKRFPLEEDFEQALRRHAMTQDDLRRMLYEHQRVTRFIEQRISFFVIVLPDEISQYYDEHRQDFPDRTYEEAQEEIESILSRQKEKKKLDLFLSKLRSEARIEISD